MVKLAGGISSLAYVRGAKLTRQMNDDERKQFEASLEMLDNTKDSISIAKLNAASVYSVGIDLEKALANPGSEADLVLREGDVISVPEYVNTVKVSGCVLYPNVITYNPKMSVSDYIEQAGGYGFGAKRKRAYIVYMNGSVAKARKFGRDIVEPGCEIIVPEKQKKEGALQNALSVASTSASLATMFATIYNIIK
jgi:protein involved in polysaccharide export with SLBB domain